MYCISKTNKRPTGMTTVTISDHDTSIHGTHHNCIVIHGMESIIYKRVDTIMNALNQKEDTLPELIDKLGNAASNEQQRLIKKLSCGVSDEGDAEKLSNISPIVSAVACLRRKSSLIVQI